MFFWIWICSIISTIYIAQVKNFNIWKYSIISIFTGPFCFVYVLLKSPEGEKDLVSQQEDLGEDIQKQLSEIKKTMAHLQKKINQLEFRTERLVPLKKKVYTKEKPPVSTKELSIKESAVSSDLEEKLGRFWLNKIGMIIFALGIGFLISYTLKSFGPYIKIFCGYALCVFLFWYGNKLERQKSFIHFGRVLISGAWALTYFMTFAMYHFEASRIIEHQWLDVCLLICVVIGMLRHAVHYQSETMIMITLMIAYMTSTIGSITILTYISCLLLASGILILVYKLQYNKILVLGVLFSYGIHYFCIVPHIDVTADGWGFFHQYKQELINLLFLNTYLLLFMFGIHFIKAKEDDHQWDILAASNFGNFCIYIFFAFPLVTKIFYDQRFLYTFSLGCIFLLMAYWKKRVGSKKLFHSDMIIAILIFTFVISLKYSTTTTFLIRIFEIPALLFVGFIFRKKVYRYLSYSLTVFVILRFIYSIIFEANLIDLRFMGYIWKWNEFILLWGMFVLAFCSYLCLRFQKQKILTDIDIIFDQIFTFFSYVCFAYLLYSFVDPLWSTLSFSLSALLFFLLSGIFKIRRLRIYAYFFLIYIFYFFTLFVYDSSLMIKGVRVLMEVGSFYGIYYYMKYLRTYRREVFLSFYEERIVLFFGFILFVISLYKYIDWPWRSLALGLGALNMLIVGILSHDKPLRVGGLLLFGLTLMRILLIDLSQLDVFYKIVSFIALGGICLVVSYIYNRYDFEKKLKLRK